MLYLVGPLVAFAGIVALVLVLRTRSRTTNRSLYSAAREDRARKVREARELALRSAAPPEPEPEPEPAEEPAPAPSPAPVPSAPEPAPAVFEPAEPESQPFPEPEPAAPEVPAWTAAPQRATSPPAAASTAAVDEPSWLPARTNPPIPSRTPGVTATEPAAVAEDDEPPPPRTASTVVSYVVLAASLVVILLGIAIMIGMSRG